MILRGAPGGRQYPGRTGVQVPAAAQAALRRAQPSEFTAHLFPYGPVGAVTFTRDMQRVRAVSVAHLPGVYAPCPPGTLGSVLAHLSDATRLSLPIFTPLDALHALYPMCDPLEAGEADRVLQDVAYEHGIEDGPPEDLERQLQEDGVPSPRDVFAELLPYCPQPLLPLGELTGVSGSHPHLRRVLRPLQALVALSRQIRDAPNELLRAGPHMNATVSGCEVLLHLSPPGDRESVCTVEHAVREQAEFGMNTAFRPVWGTPLDAAGERALLAYLHLLPTLNAVLQDVLNALSHTR